MRKNLINVGQTCFKEFNIGKGSMSWKGYIKDIKWGKEKNNAEKEWKRNGRLN